MPDRAELPPDRAEQVSYLFHAALLRPAENRHAFLTDACGGDEGLRREVESLLGYDVASERFLDPSTAGAARVTVDETASSDPSDTRSAPSIHRLTPGTMVGRYRIDVFLGEGGMGQVYRAHDARLGRAIALKILPPHLRTSPQRRSRFDREARAVARLRHPHICTLHDVGRHEGLDFLVMEYIEGETLAMKIRRGTLSVEDTLRLSGEVAGALGAAHAKGLIHRDIKPSNVIVTPDGHAVVVDFGLARDTSDFGADGIAKADLSQPGDFVGTPYYMSPEQVQGQSLDPRTDVFSLGVVMFECLTGRLPFDGDTRYRYLQNVMTADAKSLGDYRQDTPAELQEIVAGCLERDVSRRVDSAAWLSTALSQIASGVSTGEIHLPPRDASQTREWRPRSGFATVADILRERWRAVAVLAVAVAILLTTGLTWWLKSAPVPIEPGVLAILPASNPTDNPIAEQVGSAIASVVSRTFGKGSAMKVVSREVTAPYALARGDLAPLKQEAGATHVLDITVRKTSPTVDVLVRLRRPGGDVPVWEQAFSGDIIDVQSRLLAKLREGFEGDGIRLGPGNQTTIPPQLHAAHPDALMASLEARALLERPEEFGNVPRAIDMLERATSTDAQLALAHAALADALRARFATERNATLLERATGEATTAIQIDPDDSAAHTAFAAVQNESGKRDAAVTSLRRAIDLQPDNDDAHRLLGEIMAAQGHVDEGVAEVATAVRIRPAFTNYYRLGAVLFKAGRYPAALDAYGKAVERRPGHGGAYEMLGATYHMLGQPDQAIGNYEHAISVGPTATAYANLALLYFKTGAYEKARTALLSAISRNPNKASLYRDLGDVYLRLKRPKDARPHYEKAIAMSQAALKVNASDPFSTVLIAICEANLGRRAEAERHAVEALALAPSNRDVLYRVGKVYALTGNHQAALKALRGAIEHGYDRDEARHDPELESLRSRPEFEELLSEGVRR